MGDKEKDSFAAGGRTLTHVGHVPVLLGDSSQPLCSDCMDSKKSDSEVIGEGVPCLTKEAESVLNNCA